METAMGAPPPEDACAFADDPGPPKPLTVAELNWPLNSSIPSC